MRFRTLTVAAVLVVLAACADREPSAPGGLEEGTGRIQAGKRGRGRPKPPPGIRYDVGDLGALEPNTRSSARGIDKLGVQLVGSSWDRGDPFDEPTLWTVDPNGGVTVLPLEMPNGAYYAAALAITKTGIAIGASSVGPVYWDADGFAHPLPLGGASGGRANDVRLLGDDVLIVGSLSPETGPTQAVYWVIGANGSPSSPSPLPPREDGLNASAQAVNSQGTIAGYSLDYAVVWHPDALGNNYRVCHLGPSSVAFGISEPTPENVNQLHVAGVTPTTDYFATVWTVDVTSTTSGLPAEPCPVTNVRSLDFFSEFVDVNAQGDAVGEDLLTHNAIVWTGEGTLVSLPPLKKGAFSRANAIDRGGTRIAGASQGAKKTTRAVLWTRVE